MEIADLFQMNFIMYSYNHVLANKYVSQCVEDYNLLYYMYFILFTAFEIVWKGCTGKGDHGILDNINTGDLAWFVFIIVS